MEASADRLRKRLGGAAVARLVAQLRAREYDEVAALLAYYDKLYDTHIHNGSGTGSGAGARVGAVVDAAQPDELEAIDGARARAVPARVR